MIRSRCIGGLAAAALALSSPALALADGYAITDLGAATQANGIDRAGRIAGIANQRATLWVHGRRVDLGTLGGDTSDALGLNAAGDAVGYSTLAEGSYRAFLYTQGTMRDLGTLGSNYSVAYAINDAGQVVGSSDTADGRSHAFLYEAGTMTDLGTLGGDHPGWSTTAEGINAAGQVVGYSYIASGDFRAFLYSGGRMRDLGTLGGDWSQATAINPHGVVTGQAYTPGNLEAHAFTWTHGRMTDLGVLNHYSGGYAIDRHGTVVGEADVRNDTGYLVFHAVLFGAGGPVDLNTFIPPASGWTLSAATAIDERGRIVGYGQLHGITHGFLLTPQ